MEKQPHEVQYRGLTLTLKMSSELPLAVPQRPQRPPIASKAIQHGADAVLALIEQESKRRHAHLEEQLQVSQKEIQALKDALDKFVVEAAAAQADALRARRDLSIAKKALIQLKTALGSMGIAVDETTAGNGQGETNVIFRPIINSSGHPHSGNNAQNLLAAHDDVRMLEDQNFG